MRIPPVADFKAHLIALEDPLTEGDKTIQEIAAKHKVGIRSQVEQPRSPVFLE